MGVLDRYTPVPIGGKDSRGTTAGDSIKIPVSKSENTRGSETKGFPEEVLKLKPSEGQITHSKRDLLRLQTAKQNKNKLLVPHLD